ncbi:MAG: hypothetical protein Q7T17_07505 [Microbacterium sp.]|uniref:hypothetical protein n=1 Tax=Microbacterium sp. TaxID=51671 RepID=UPI00271F5B4B|nr:hypothetical protein [Microbacterium sp.]MDO8382807.1 hypothetical protein [Microbacterium sp.]
MTSDQFRPVVAIEVTGLLGVPFPPNIDTKLLADVGAGSEITFRRGAFPSRFVGEPVWEECGEHRERWAFLGQGSSWVKSLLGRDVDVVWASRYQEYVNTYFGAALGLPELPVAARDDGRFHTTEADWKASQLSIDDYADRPLLWVNDELTTAGRHLLERYRKPAMRALTCSKYIPDSASNGDVQFMSDWLELTQSPSGQGELRRQRARFTNARRRRGFSTERMHREWVLVRTRLEYVVDFRSGLAAPLAAYAVDHAGELDVRVVAQIREEWGLAFDPPAEELLPLLSI